MKDEKQYKLAFILTVAFIIIPFVIFYFWYPNKNVYEIVSWVLSFLYGNYVIFGEPFQTKKVFKRKTQIVIGTSLIVIDLSGLILMIS
jgi:hypothetical protein